MKFSPSAAVLVFLAFSMKVFAFPGIEMRRGDDTSPASPNERAQRATTGSSDRDSAAAHESAVEERGSVTGIAETENNAGNSEDSSARNGEMEKLPDCLTSLSRASSAAAAAATEEEISFALQTGSDGAHRITPLSAAGHSYVLSDPSTYPTYPEFQNVSSSRSLADCSVSVAPPRVSGSITPETLKAAAVSARATAQAAREASNEDGSYLVPQLGRLGNVSSASISPSQRIENKVALIMEELSERVVPSVQQAKAEVQNSITSAERVAAKLERAAVNLQADSQGEAARPENRIKLQSIMQEAADATEGAERVAKSLRTATSPSAYLLHLTAAATEQKAHMALRIQSVAGENTSAALKEIKEEAILVYALTEIALNAAEAFHSTATVDAMDQPDDQPLQDRLAAAATLVVALRSMATDSYNMAQQLLLKCDRVLLERVTLNNYANDGSLSIDINLASKSAQMLCRSAIDAAEQLQSFSSSAEGRSAAINNFARRALFQQNTTQRIQSAIAIFTTPFVSGDHDAGFVAIYDVIKLNPNRVAAYNDAVTAAQESALQESILNSPRAILLSGLNDVATTVEDVNNRLKELPAFFVDSAPHASLQYCNGLARKTAEVAGKETQKAVSSADDLAKPIRVMIAKSKMIAAMNFFTKFDQASAILNRPYLWKKELERERENLLLLTKIFLGRAEATSELTKIDRAIKTIVPDSLDEEMAAIFNRSELPEFSRKRSEQSKSLLATWRKFVSTSEERRLIAARAREGLSAIMRLGNDAAQSIQTKRPQELSWRGKVGAGFSGGLETIDAMIPIANMFRDAVDRDVMDSQHKVIFDAAAAVASDAAKAGKVICNTTSRIVSLHQRNQIPANSYQELKEAVADAYAAAAEAMNAYDAYNAADVEAAKVIGKIKMTTSQRNAEVPAQALQQISQTMDPSIAPPPRSVMEVINDAVFRSEAALARAQEAAARIQPVLDIARAAQQDNGGWW